MASASNFVVDPGLGMVIWVLVASLSIPAAAVTVAKGRWGWFALGLPTCGICWLIGAFQPATPTSWWGKRDGRDLI